jgi:Ferritin-like domain
MRGAAVRRGLLAALAVVLLAAGLSGCGGSSQGGEPTEDTGNAGTAEREADVAVLSQVLSRQLGVVAAYERVLHGLGRPDLATARLFRAQEQEHLDATIKTLRGLGGEVKAEPEEIESSGLRSRADYVEFLYEMESATIGAELGAIAKLSTPSARTVLASTVANQAQHLVLLRRELGAKPLDTVPAPFENGSVPAPSERMNR